MPAVREDDASIVSEYALRGERVLAILRLVFWGFMAVASAVIGGLSGEPPETSRARVLVVFGWLVFGIAVLLLLRRARFTPRRALLWPMLIIIVDTAVIVYLNLDSARAARPEVGTSILAILLAFSVARFSAFLVWFGAALAIAGILIQAMVLGWFNARSVSIVVVSYLSLALLIWWANGQITRMFVDVRRREHLARFLPQQVAARILAEGSRSLEPVQREVSILFSDIRDFTSLSQRMDPRQVLALLDQYFARMTAIVKGHEGMVNKFLGDGLLVVWGVPDPQPDHATRAVRAALEMQRAVAELNVARAAAGEPALRIGIGIHTGEVAAGMLGGPDQSEYTVLGDAVNVASRVEGLSKNVGADVVVTESTWRHCGSSFAGERVGAEPVKGRDEPVVVYRVTGASAGA
ncbi:MAG: adenylate/guanylate cyclase domain-containing protein [Planctomycetes bacterium]|nr:adenylate/guanylate cyclase domain-containing protein [Planctomycetota bacterium]